MDYILHGIPKSRTWLNDFHFHFSLSQSYGFSSGHVLMWELDHKEGWVQKNSCFWTVVLEKTLESPLTSKEIKPVNPKGINAEYSLKGLMLKLKLQYFGHLMQIACSLEKTLKLGKIEGRRRRGWQRMRWLNNITNSIDMNLNKLWEILKERGAWPAVVHEVSKSQTWLSKWTTTDDLLTWLQLSVLGRNFSIKKKV